VPDAGGGTSTTALAGEVLHFTITADVAAPYHGQAPPKRAQLEASASAWTAPSGAVPSGMGWFDAEAAAVDVTLRALALMGAERPMWQQGQPEWMQVGVIAPWREPCAWCGKPIEDDRKAKYCSAICSKVARGHFYNKRKNFERIAAADAVQTVVQSR